MRKLLIVVFFLLVFVCLFLTLFIIPSQATRIYGPSASWLTISQRIQYSAQLLWYDGLLTRPLDVNGSEQSFTIGIGESVNSVAYHLQEAGIVRNAEAFRAYLIYSGLDTSIQAGEYKLSPAMSAIDIAHELQDATTTEVPFTVLPGWRTEEIAASIPTSGLSFTPDDFLAIAQSPSNDFDFLSGARNLEGFLYPDSYIFPRNMTASEFVDALVRNFSQHLSPDLTNAFSQRGLTVYQAVTLASIVERETVHDEEKPMIASVYLNRLKIGMKLDADPTVQYAMGYDFAGSTWWKNPLSLTDLQYDSYFNTYLYAGLPPTPIANPSLVALNAVAFPAESTYYFFRAKCDGSGYHVFAETFDEQLANGCQ
jgi:peptidoglycan lytic transglycosylase G